ncbi:MAG: amidophosphoribosyltransferase [Xanthomonadales bacterium]|nr:amidophosphoribosyltransferase [Xanthomonadales bacterium]NIN60718.1 amidophosphoribosyltransferase [Xanthomonadales bacterium]NIN76080.1 amidophosphoribosyltransferase [Xanthomonadales bacterium]NIO15301.1 amidophosphoribosyltransferase [Xanthomonadales bacterium]NIP13111.1 amidophosphoribosyltransferase [Xanthomonadales bacterium]
MCGIIGMVGSQPVAPEIYEALTVLQHRGQDAAGIATLDGHRLHLAKANGLVRDVFTAEHVARLRGSAGIGHVRYPTAGCEDSAEAQPFYVNSPHGIALGHNGNLNNTEELKAELIASDRRHLNTDSDSEVLLNILAHELHSQDGGEMSAQGIFRAVDGVHQRCRGAYAVIALIVDQGILGFRDPHGIRPVVLGRREGKRGTEYAIASESVALDTLGFELMRDLRPGEAVLIDFEGRLHEHQSRSAQALSPCIFEFVYFARPDSMIDDISVYKARLRMGQALSRKILSEWPDHDIDVVIPVPDTSRTAALPLAYDLGVKYREGFIKNRYIGRTFIMPGQDQRAASVRHKLNAIELEFRRKNVLLVDDSIVRGTTSRQIIQMAREAGARKVYFASAAPPVRYPNIYGIDMPAPAELVASGKDESAIERELGADRLIYQRLDDLVEACREGNSRITRFDTSCFSGEYVTGVEPGYLEKVQQLRSDRAKSERRSQSSAPRLAS